MEAPQIFGRLTTIFQDVFDDDDLVATPHLTAEDVAEWDSLSHLRLMLSVEKSFGVRFSAAEIGRLKNVGDLAALIQTKL